MEYAQYHTAYEHYNSCSEKNNIYIIELSYDIPAEPLRRAFIEVGTGEVPPRTRVPSRYGYNFVGYYSEKNGGGIKYYQSDGTAIRKWEQKNGGILYAYWEPVTYTITFDNQGIPNTSLTVTYSGPMPSIKPPKRDNYTFLGYFAKPNGEGAQYYGATGSSSFSNAKDITVYAYWKANSL